MLCINQITQFKMKINRENVSIAVLDSLENKENSIKEILLYNNRIFSSQLIDKDQYETNRNYLLYQQYLNDMVKGYLECAQWTNEDLDNVDNVFWKSTLNNAKNDCDSFLTQVNDLTSLEASQMGHDFWLTRNRHGAGFFDRTNELTEPQIETFTKVAQSFKEVNIFLNNKKLLIE